MPTPVTPTPASSSKLVQTTNDSAVQTYEAIGFVSSTASVASVNQTGEAMFGRALVLTTSYTLVSVISSTYQVTTASASNQYTVTKVVSSAPVVLTSVTQYHTVVPTNTTVWNSFASPSSLMLAAGQNDIVSYKAVVVAGTEA